MQIALPSQFNDSGALRFIAELAEHLEDAELLLDFRFVEFVYPYGTLLIAHAIKNIAARRRRIGLTTQVLGHQNVGGAVSYLRYFGFFKYINVNGADEQHAPGGGRYLPLTVLNKNALTTERPGGQFQDAIEECSFRLARIILPGQIEQSAIEMLAYCFRELVRNSFEHAEVATCAVMAQRWDNGVAEVAIADRGIGVYRALAKAHNIGSPDEAVRLAIRPGISSGAGSATGGKWDNTGFGLYVVSQLGRKFGSFALLSAERYLNPGRDTSDLVHVSLPGTLVKLRVSTRNQEDWGDVLAGIVTEGEIEAQSIPGAVTRASAGSKKSNTWDGWG